VRFFKPWGWIIGTGTYINDVQSNIYALQKKIAVVFLLFMVIVAFGMGFFAFLAVTSNTKREQEEQDKINTEKRFRTLFDLLPFSCVINDFDGHILEANQYHCTVAGLSHESIRGKSTEDLNRHVPSEDRKALLDEIKSTGQIQQKELKIKTPKGEQWIIFSSTLIDWHGSKAVLTATVDITKRKASELEAQNTNERMKSQREALAFLAESREVASGIAAKAFPVITEQVSKALNVERVAIWIFEETKNKILNIEQYIASSNKHYSGNSLSLDDYPSYFEALRRDTRVDAHDVFEDPRVKELVKDWFIPNHITSLMDAEIIQEGVFIGLFSCEHTGEKRRWHADEQSFVSSIAALVGQIFATDIKIGAEVCLKENEENMRATLNSIGDGVIVTDIDGRITRMNPVAESLTGWSMENAFQKELTEVLKIYRSDRMRYINPFEEALLNTDNPSDSIEGSILISKNSQEYQITETTTPIYSVNDKMIGVVVVFKNVTENKKLQEQIYHIQKMESIGQLASGVAHDFNNMIGGIMGATDLLELSCQSDENSAKLIKIIVDAAERAAELTSKLLSFARKQTLSSSPIDVLSPLRDAISLLKSTADRRIVINHCLLDHECLIIGDPAQLQSAFMNLLINATHAMPDGGKLSISTSFRDLDEKQCQVMGADLSPGKFIEIEIEDTGTGIPHENLRKIFEPFYTTKEQGRGTGLGLAAVLGTIEQHKGSIQVYSEIGVGTCFHILLPIADKNLDKITSLPEEPVKGTGTILLIDDEEIMRSTGKMILEDLGYDVMTVDNGYLGLELFKKMFNVIDLVILDMIMPEMNGKDCFLEMKKINPDAKVILSSGFSREEDVKNMKEHGLKGFIRKPYRRSVLSHSIQSALKS
jgi:PAS domain S-box-containing protein